WPAGVRVTPFHLTLEQTSEGYSLLGWPDAIGEARAGEALLITLADPFTFPAEDYLRLLNEERPGVPVVGGMASGSRQPRQNRLLYGDTAVGGGAISVLLQGPLGFRGTVSQGCRPVGKPM